jgi:hypothetical protein
VQKGWQPVRETPIPPEPVASDPLTATDIDHRGHS